MAAVPPAPELAAGYQGLLMRYAAIALLCFCFAIDPWTLLRIGDTIEDKRLNFRIRDWTPDFPCDVTENLDGAFYNHLRPECSVRSI
jgi:hypothetical protein